MGVVVRAGEVGVGRWEVEACLGENEKGMGCGTTGWEGFGVNE